MESCCSINSSFVLDLERRENKMSIYTFYHLTQRSTDMIYSKLEREEGVGYSLII